MQKALWQSVLGEIEVSVSHATYTTWFKNTELMSISDNEVVIAVPNIFAKKQFEVKFNDHIKTVLSRNNITPEKISYVVPMNSKKPRNREEILESKTPTDSQPTKKTVQHTFSAGPAVSIYADRGNLNPRYTFSNFIVGSSNDLAYTASQAVAANPGVKYNPLYLYGGVGLGKTHLVQAIGNEILKNNPNAKVLYINTETFVNEFLDHIRYKKKGFAEKYRHLDVLIVDDMQFIAGKEKNPGRIFPYF